MAKEDFKIQEFSKNDLDQLVDLFHLIYGGDKILLYSKLKWAFCNIRSKALVIKNSFDNIVAVRGGILWPMKLKNNLIHTIQFGGTCVHPNYRRKGLFTLLTKRYVQICRIEGINLIYNVSVNSAKLGYQKLGWQYKKGFQRLTKFHCNYNFPKIDVTKFLVNTIPNEILLKRSELLNEFIHTFYDNNLIEWRLSCASESYKIFYSHDFYILYKLKISKKRRNLIIGEVFSKDFNFKKFLKAFRLLFKSERPHLTLTYIHFSHPFYKFYILLFFIPNFTNLNLNLGFNYLDKNLMQKKWTGSYIDIDTF